MRAELGQLWLHDIKRENHGTPVKYPRGAPAYTEIGSFRAKGIPDKKVHSGQPEESLS